MKWQPPPIKVTPPFPANFLFYFYFPLIWLFLGGGGITTRLGLKWAFLLILFVCFFEGGSFIRGFQPTMNKPLTLFCFFFSPFVTLFWLLAERTRACALNNIAGFALHCTTGIGPRDPIYSALPDDDPSMDVASPRDRDLGSPLVLACFFNTNVNFLVAMRFCVGEE